MNGQDSINQNTITQNTTNHNSTFANPPQSYWMGSTEQPDYPPLDEGKHINVDVAVAGGGMAGLLTAYFLKKAGLKVAVLEADKILQGTTGHTTAKITSQHDIFYSKLIGKIGEEKAKLYAQANEEAIRKLEKLAVENGIDCDFHRCPAYIYTNDENELQKIYEEEKAASSLGIKAVYTADPGLPFPVLGALRFDDQARFHPRKLLLPIAEKIPGDGSHIFEQTKVKNIEEDNGTCTVETSRGKVYASKVVIATHYPCYDPAFYFARLYPERSYALGLRIRESFPDGMYISIEDPTHSFRLQEDGDNKLLILGGEHHKTGQGGRTSAHYENLLGYAKSVFTVEDVPYRWSTQDYTTPDEIPYIGLASSKSDNIYIATGFRKWGMTTSMVAAELLTDLIVRGDSPYKEVYDPRRTTIAASAKNFIVENANVALELITGKLAPVPDDVEIAKGEARVYEKDGTKIGAYRDEKGNLHEVNPTCTHMGCELQWNDAELTWDCPCHGSRFTYEGDIVEGPALKPIKADLKREVVTSSHEMD